MFRVSLRSKGAVDVRAVAARWQGGGHTNAAGCTVTGQLHVVRARLADELDRALSTGAAGPQVKGIHV